MDSIKEEKEEENDYVKLFLQIHYPKIEDKPYYKIDFEKNILILFDPVNRTNSEKDGIFEMDQIFTNENDNSYIYEEVCSNTVTESLKGESYSFISYGNTISDKLKILIGDVNDSYRKVAHRGLFPKILEELINTINNNMSYRDNISINLSYFIIYNDKMIDLSNFMGKNLNNCNEESFLKKAVELDKQTENLKNIKKVPTENINDVVFFINKLFLLLINLEEGSKHHLYSRSHFSTIIYIINNNGEIISTLTFILLNGSEIMNKSNNPEQINKILNKEHFHRNNVESSLLAVDTQYTYNSIIYSLKNNNYINKIADNEEKDNNSSKVFDYTEKNKISKLTRLLYDICFSPKKKNIKFRIIGTILPNTGYYDNCKDTLMFLFNCRQAITTVAKNNKAKTEKLKDNQNENTNIRSRIMRNDTIFDLENKVKIKTNTIMELNKNIEKKNEKIFQLEKYYKKQVDILKKYFGFSGSVEILLSGDENTQDYKEAQKIRDAKEEINYYKKNVNDLENKIKNKDDEIEKLKIENAIKLNDKTMIKYYFGINDTKKKREKDSKSRNDTFNQIQFFEKELKNKDKIINILKTDLEKKSNIIMSLPKAIKNHIDNKDNESSVSDDEIISIQKKKKKIDKNDLIQLSKDNSEEIKNLKLKYDNLIMQKDKEILENNYQINKIIKENNDRINLYEEELMKLYELFRNVINYTYKNFLSILNEKNNLITILSKKEEFENYLKNSEKQINAYNYPFIFKALNTINKKNTYLHKNNKSEKIIFKSQKKLINKNDINYTKEMEEIALNFEDITSPTMKQIKDFIISNNSNNNFIIKKNELEKTSKDRLILIYNNTIKYTQQLENYIKKYSESKEKSNNQSEENKKIIHNYIEKIKNLNILLDKEVQKNNKNMVIISSLNKMIEKLQKESIISKNILKYKNDNSVHKISLTKSKDKYQYPLIVHDQCHTISNNDNNFINYKKSSLQVKWRNNTETNYPSNPSTYHPTNGTSGYSSFTKTFAPTLDSNNTTNKFKNKKRPFSSFQNRIKKKVS